MTNVTPSLLDKVGRYLHNTRHHPINLIKERIVHHFHKTYTNNMGNPIYTSIEDTPPVVTTEQNFDSLHVSTRLFSVRYMHCNWKYCTGAVTLFHKIYIIIPNFQCHLFYYLSFSLSLSRSLWITFQEVATTVTTSTLIRCYGLILQPTSETLLGWGSTSSSSPETCIVATKSTPPTTRCSIRWRE